MDAVIRQQTPASVEETWIEQLGSEEGGTRQRARKSLVALGRTAVPSLIRTLRESSSAHARWGAAKALGEIGDARAIPELVAALDDVDSDVAWLAADGLRRFKRAAWPTLLHRLIRDGSHSILLRQRALWVFRDPSAEECDELLAALVDALRSYTVSETAAITAYEVLHHMNEVT